MPQTPLEAYAFDARFGKRSVFILDRRLFVGVARRLGSHWTSLTATEPPSH